MLFPYKGPKSVYNASSGSGKAMMGLKMQVCGLWVKFFYRQSGFDLAVRLTHWWVYSERDFSKTRGLALLSWCVVCWTL